MLVAVVRREAVAQSTTQGGEEREESKVWARKVLTAAEHHEADHIRHAEMTLYSYVKKGMVK